MVRTVFLALVFTTGPLFARAQSITVIDAASRTPIADVFIINQSSSHSVLTNARGQADLSGFAEGSQLTLQHPSYQTATATLTQLAKRGEFAMQEKVVRMNEVLVSGNKWEQDRREIPNKITAVSARDIALTNPQTSADLLQQTGQVFVQKSQLGGGSPMMRGFAANSVLMVVDGVRMNNAIYRSGNLQNILNIDANMLQSAEVVLGPGSVIYGSDALGGVMDFHTVDPDYGTEEKPYFKGNVFGRYSSANRERTVSGQASTGGNRWAFSVGATFSAFDDLRTGRNGLDDYGGYGRRNWYVERINGTDSILQNPNPAIQIGSGYSTTNTMGKFKYRLGDQLELSYTTLYSTTSNVPRYDRLIEQRNGAPRSAEWYYGPQQWWHNALRLHHFAPTALYDESKITGSYQQYSESRHDRSFGSDLLRHRTEAVAVYTFNWDLDKVITDRHQVFYGAEWVHNAVSSFGERENIVTGEIAPTASRYPDLGSTYTTLAAYLNHKWYPWEKATLTTGLRYSHVLLQGGFSDQFYDFPFNEINLNTGALNGSMGLAQRLGEHWQLNALASSGFRAPNVDDAGKVFDSEPGNVVVPNPNLAPEYVYNTELGLRYTVEGKLDLQATGFYAWYINAMVRRPFSLNGQDSLVYDGTPSRIEAIVNTGQANIYGLSGQATYTPNASLVFKGSITWNQGMDLDGNVPLRHTTPLFGQLSATYQRAKWRLEVFVPFNGARPWDQLAPSEQDKPHLYPPGEVGSPAWYTLNLRGNFQVTDKLSAQLALENILDLHYRPYSSGISAPGRNLLLAVRRKF